MRSGWALEPRLSSSKARAPLSRELACGKGFLAAQSTLLKGGENIETAHWETELTPPIPYSDLSNPMATGLDRKGP